MLARSRRGTDWNPGNRVAPCRETSLWVAQTRLQSLLATNSTLQRDVMTDRNSTVEKGLTSRPLWWAASFEAAN